VTVLLLGTPRAYIAAIGLLAALCLAVAINIPEAFAVAIASRRVTFFFKGMALNLLHGFAWGAGLGVGTVLHIAAPASDGKDSP